MTRQRQTYSTISDLKKDFPLFSPIYSLVSKTFTHLTKPKLKNLSALILTFFQHTSFALYNIAQAFPANTTYRVAEWVSSEAKSHGRSVPTFKVFDAHAKRYVEYYEQSRKSDKKGSD